MTTLERFLTIRLNTLVETAAEKWQATQRLEAELAKERLAYSRVSNGR